MHDRFNQGPNSVLQECELPEHMNCKIYFKTNLNLVMASWQGILMFYR